MITLDYTPREAFVAFHRRKGKRACLVCHRRSGKTVACVADLVDDALRFKGTDGRFGYVAPYYRQAKDIAWTYLKNMVRDIPGAVINEGEIYVMLPSAGGTPSRVKLYGADNPDAMRGVYFDGVVLDEVADMRPELLSEVVLPALADRAGWLAVIGTPKGYNLFYSMWQKALRDRRWHTLMLRASESGILPAEVLADLKREMPDSKYAQEMECDFSQAAEAQFIPTDLVEDAEKRVGAQVSSAAAPRLLGVDVARFGDDESVILIRKGRVVEAVKRYKKNDTVFLVNEVAAWANETHPRMIFVDGAGVGGGVVDMLKEMGFPVRDVNVGTAATRSKHFINRRAELWWKMREWIPTAQFDLQRDDAEVMRLELVAPQYGYDNAGRVYLEKKSDMKARGVPSPNIADALALTFDENLAAAGLMTGKSVKVAPMERPI